MRRVSACQSPVTSPGGKDGDDGARGPPGGSDDDEDGGGPGPPKMVAACDAADGTVSASPATRSTSDGCRENT